jgi:hypothetical protein
MDVASTLVDASTVGFALPRATQPTLLAWMVEPAGSPVGAEAQSSPAADGADADSLGFGSLHGGDGDSLGFAAQPSAAGEPGVGPIIEDVSPWTASATLRVQGAVRLDSADRLAKLRQVFEGRLEWQHDLGSSWQIRAITSGRTEVDFALLADTTAYRAPDIDVYGWQLLPRETYLSLSSSGFSLSFGEQIANLGQGEVLSVLDVVNPRDLREPLLADLSEIRMPVLMTRLAATLGTVRFELFAVHEPYFGLTPPPLGEFSPFRRLILESAAPLATRTLSNAHWPRRDVTFTTATQGHARMSWSGPSIDLTLSASSVLDPLGVPALPPAAAFDSQAIALPILHPRYTLFGQSGALTLGAFVLRWEAAFELSRRIALRDTSTPLLRLSSVRRSGVRGLLGLTYVPSASTNAGLEIVHAYLLDSPNRVPGSQARTLFPLEEPQLALRASQRFLRDRANLSVLVVRIGARHLNAWVSRVELGYAVLDNVEVTLGCVTYHPTNRFGFFYGFTAHDRVFLDLRWDLGG